MAVCAALPACSSGIFNIPEPSSPARASMTPRNGLEVIGAMRRAHPSRKLRTLAFTVTTTEDSDSARARAHASLPGRLRITELPASRKTGTVRDHDRLSVFEQGRRVGSHERVDLSMLLAYDVFAQGIDTTIRWLDIARVRFALARQDELDGRSVWVVGAHEGDTTSTQFWVDAHRWRVVRVIQRDPERPGQIVDVRYHEFKELMDVPVPMLVEVRRPGKPARFQRVSNIVANPSVSRRAFDLGRWRDVRVAN